MNKWKTSFARNKKKLNQEKAKEKIAETKQR